MTFSFKKFSSGETLIEAIIAVSILMVVLAPASAMVITSSRTINQNRNDLVAAALAEEGLEIMKNIRDSNMIRFAQKSDLCWNTQPNTNISLATCDVQANKIGGGDVGGAVRILNLQSNPTTLKWAIDNNGAGVAEMPAPPITNYQLYYDVATEIDKECPAIGGCHFHTGTYFYPDGTDSPPFPRGQLSPYYRQVFVQYIDFDQDGDIDPVMKVTSKVQYSAAGGMKTIKRILFLTNKPAK